MPEPDRPDEAASPEPLPHSLPAEAVLEELEVSAAEGLPAAEVARRRLLHGPNVLREHVPPPWWRILLGQLRSAIVALLVVAALVAWGFGERVEAAAIAAVLALNTLIGFTTEMRAVRSMDALRKLGRVRARVRRGGGEEEVDAQTLVPGDILLLEGGDMIPADARLVEASRLHADEAILTGESVPVVKSTEEVAEAAPLAERTSMVFKGTSLTRGAGVGVVVRTGMHTELGRIASLVVETEDEITPLEARLDQLGGQLLGVTVVMILLVTGGGVAAGHDLYTMLETGISLAVASVPEGLPIVATMCLARGMWRLARRNALITSLAAVETLGATTVVLTDKTGTLTTNRMRLSRARVPEGEVERTLDGAWLLGDAPVGDPTAGSLGRLLVAGALCSDAALDTSGAGVGDPLEVALLEAAAGGGLRRDALLEAAPEVREEAFDADVRRMATVHEAAEGGYRVYVKGAPDAVLPNCTGVAHGEGERPLDAADRTRWEEENEGLARRGLRVLALATRAASSPEEPPYRDLVLLGLVGLEDPPRREVAAALATCRRAGVRVLMVTGDQPVTAESIARAVGLLAEGEDAEVVAGGSLGPPARWDAATRERLARSHIFARFTPEQKLGLLELFQERGEIVAMTGDGVNDAPALHRSDIGVAMGLRGTQVAKEAADMVLLDDSFTTIVHAMAQGRVILGNIRNFLVYLLSCNLAEILLIGVSSGLGLPLPILPLQILYLNLVTDVFPAFALGFGEEEGDVMTRPPRPPGTPVLEREQWTQVAAYGAFLALSTLAAFVATLRAPGGDEAAAVSVAFATLSLGQTLHVFNMRDPGARLASNEVTRNPYVWGALVLCGVLTLFALAAPGVSEVLKLSVPDAAGWGRVAAGSVAPLVFGVAFKRWRAPPASGSGGFPPPAATSPGA